MPALPIKEALSTHKCIYTGYKMSMLTPTCYMQEALNTQSCMQEVLSTTCGI